MERTPVNDGLHMPTIKAHSVEKIRRHNFFARMFATGMKNKWPQRAYIGLYSGAGLARLDSDGSVVETTALSALREPFTHYIFVDSDPECIRALEQRARPYQDDKSVHFVLGDANECVPAVRSRLPRFSKANGLLSFCFVDPFNAGVKLETIKGLASLKMDFLILLAAGLDVRRNWRLYLSDEKNSRIADFIDCPDWRREFRDSGEPSPIRFVMRKFDAAMVGLGYKQPRPAHHHAIKTNGRFLYYLSFYSKHERGQGFCPDSC